MLSTATTLATSVLGAIAWDPEIRNILALVVGLVFLCGSVWLLVSTNTGMRSGMLIAIAAMSGWCVLMGGLWTMYGNVGLIGRPAQWQVEEINFGDISDAALVEARTLEPVSEVPAGPELFDTLTPEQQGEVIPPVEDDPEDPFTDAELAELQDQAVSRLQRGQIADVAPEVFEDLDLLDTLGGWRLLATSDGQRGDAVSTADEALGPDGSGVFAEPGEYVVLDAYSIGGKDRRPEDASFVERLTHRLGNMVQFSHPAHYAVVQVQAVEAQEEPAPGEAPALPVADEDAQVISVVMLRDLGSNRLPSFAFTVISVIFFGLSCNALHRRDKVVARVRATPA